ncbi:MAG: nuclear transport factor 2 family protein [Alphaproteobacteria bacterium]|nr:nuclear transport factor 2 family protein [Alphaproteobacteria bacterium]
MADLSRRLLLVLSGAMALAPLAALLAAPARAEPSLELGPILDKYAATLKAADVEAAVRLFTANGSYLSPGNPVAVGEAALRAAHQRMFQRLAFDDVEYDIQEAAKYAETGWLRSTAKGRLKLKSSGREEVLAYNQLVVFQPEAGVWKIRSYAWTPAQ